VGLDTTNVSRRADKTIDIAAGDDDARAVGTVASEKANLGKGNA
jgi:hypothetical protein